MKKAAFDAAPDQIVSDGGFAFGRYSTVFNRLNMLDVDWPFRFNIPKIFKSWRLKEWQAFHVGDSRWFFFAVLANFKLCSMAQFVAYDRETGRRYSVRRILPGSDFHFKDSLSASHVSYHGPRTIIEASCDYAKGAINLTVAHGARSAEHRFSGRFSFRCDPKTVTPNVVCLPLSFDRAMYSTKILMPMEGEFSVGGECHSFEGPSAMGLFDDHKGYYPYQMSFDWVAGFGSDDKSRRIGFTLTDNQVKDQLKYNENCLWVDGRLWPLPPVKITRPQGVAGDWVIQDMEGMVDLVFIPAAKNDLRFNVGLIESDFSAPMGSFKGFLKTGDGEKIPADILFGCGEKQDLRA